MCKQLTEKQEVILSDLTVCWNTSKRFSHVARFSFQKITETLSTHQFSFPAVFLSTMTGQTQRFTGNVTSLQNIITEMLYTPNELLTSTEQEQAVVANVVALMQISIYTRSKPGCLYTLISHWDTHWCDLGHL